MSSPVADVLSGLVHALQSFGAGWYLFGAQAALLYGSRRLTADVDVTVMLGSATSEQLLERLTKRDFKLRVSDVDDFVAATRVLPLVHEPTQMPVDVVLGGPGLEQLFLEGCVTLDVAGLSVPVLRPEHLIVTKLLAGRPRDLDDASAVMRSTEVDTVEIDELVSAIADGLGEDDIRVAWTDLRLRGRT